jgi:hypothetical protein
MMRVRGLIAEDRALAVLLPEVERLRQLEARFRAAVSPALARACRVAAWQDGMALIHCANGAAAARVRSQATTLAKAMSTPAQPVEALKVKLRADWNRPAGREKPGMSRKALDAWGALESNLPEGGLKQSIDRLLRRQRSG